MRILRYILMTVFGMAAGIAAPLCVPGTLASYEALGSTGCTIVSLTYRDFQFSTVSSSGGAIPIPSSAINVTPSIGPGEFGLTYSSVGFSVVFPGFVQYLLAYTVDPEPPIIHGFRMLLDVDGPTFPGFVDVTRTGCLDAAFVGAVCPTSTVTQSVFDNQITFNHEASTTFAPVNVLGVRTVITLDATAGGTSNFTSISETTLAPEPAVGLWAGGAALLLIGFRRRLTG